MEEMKINLQDGLVTKAISKILKKKVLTKNQINADLSVLDLHLNWKDGKAIVKTTVEFELTTTEILKLMSKI